MSVYVVPKLEQGDLVLVTWHGGNGPHFYVVDYSRGQFYARTPRDVMLMGEDCPMRFYNPLIGELEDRTLHHIQVERGGCLIQPQEFEFEKGPHGDG